ncbi:hypothetical protein T492DRAFT_860979 [Pavlovales sp. CCMP2436]|nr:hypothetical protein T492DRAFT_860979 [Pavlovales sp. CCMP2436]
MPDDVDWALPAVRVVLPDPYEDRYIDAEGISDIPALPGKKHLFKSVEDIPKLLSKTIPGPISAADVHFMREIAEEMVLSGARRLLQGR